MIRKGFVSNSSSSSFVILGDGYNFDKEIEIIFGTKGEHRFGWGPNTFYSFEAKANWAFLIGKYFLEYEVKYMKEFIKETLTKEKIFDYVLEDYMIEEVLENGYIDHQSLERENSIMWNSHENMTKWLFDKDSYIELDNDNDDDYY